MRKIILALLLALAVSLPTASAAAARPAVQGKVVATIGLASGDSIQFTIKAIFA